MDLVTLHWQQAGQLAALAAVSGLALRAGLALQAAQDREVVAGTGVAPRVRPRWPRVVGKALLETSVVLGLFTFWQVAGGWALTRVDGAFQRAHWIVGAELRMGLPSELTVQQVVLGHDALIRFLNLFYLYVHINSIVAFLVWMFVRHRAQYRWARNTIVLVTGSCLLVQMIPVAPPRMLTDLGFVDLALQYGQSVYGAFGSGVADQLSALPSVHVAWALLIAFFVITVSTSRWRWLILLHPVATIFVVVATANHFWLDGIAAGLLMAVALPVTDALERRRRRRTAASHVTPEDAREMLTVT
ncbi:MAG: phosphatase PAP2 family protein [Actinomycetes bacterium]